jgi:hypothetical protein
MAYFVFVIMRFIGKAQNPKLADFAIFPTDWWVRCLAFGHNIHSSHDGCITQPSLGGGF